MKLLTFFIFSLLALKGGHSADVYKWNFDRNEKCRFNYSDDTTHYSDADLHCKRYFRNYGHNKSEAEWGFMWKSGSREVHYIPRTGMIGFGGFTIGELYDSNYKDGAKIENAVSYEENRDSIVIGVVNEGYEFHSHFEN